VNSQLSKGIIFIVIIQILGIVAIQSRIWNDDGVQKYHRLKHNLSFQDEKNRILAKKNQKMKQEIKYLKSPDALEEYAREELGMLGEGEKYYQIKER
jgi:cell division protein FtsB